MVRCGCTVRLLAGHPDFAAGRQRYRIWTLFPTTSFRLLLHQQHRFGGAVERLAILSLGIFPYIFGLIFMLLVAATFPRVKALKNAGAQGRKRINQYARYLAIVLPHSKRTASHSALSNGQGLWSNPAGYFVLARLRRWSPASYSWSG